MARILLIRHGETEWNKQGRFQGSTDIPLSDTGYEQARLLSAQLADKHLAAVWSSPLRRALDTARAVAAPHRLPVKQHRDLREIEMGQWEGLTIPQVEARWGEEFANWRHDPLAAPAPPGGEQYRDFQTRCIGALDDVAGQYDPEQQIAVVCHGGVIKAVLAGILELPWRPRRGVLWFMNCSITRLRWETRGRVVVDGFNDSCHLE